MAETIPDVSGMVAERAVDDWTQEQGRVTVRRRRSSGAGVLRLFGIPPVFTIHLDPLGSEVWLLIDGTRTVGQIRAELERAHPGETDFGARLGKFIGAMVSRRIVRLRPS